MPIEYTKASDTGDEVSARAKAARAKAAGANDPAASGAGRQTQKPAAGNKTAQEVIDASDLRFDCLRSAIYNAAREHWYDTLHRWLSFFVIVGGSGAAATIARDNLDVALALAAFAAGSSGVSLAFDFAGRAREHGNLRRRFYELLGELERDPNDPSHLAGLMARLYALYGEERPHMNALNAIAWNEAADILFGLDEKPRIEVTRWQSFMRFLLPFSASRPRFKK